MSGISKSYQTNRVSGFEVSAGGKLIEIEKPIERLNHFKVLFRFNLFMSDARLSHQFFFISSNTF